MRMLYKQGRHLRSSVWCPGHCAVHGAPVLHSTIRGRSQTMGKVNHLRHLPISLSKRKGPETIVRELWMCGVPGLCHLQPGHPPKGHPAVNHVYSFVTGEPHTALVLLLNRGTTTLLQSVFWYKPKRVEERFRLCHPLVWEHAEVRSDPGKLEHLTLLSCYSADEK